MFRIPYRWLPRTIWPNLRCMYLDVFYGIRNIWRWLPVIWFDDDGDWCFLAVIMEIKFRRMAERMNGRHVGDDKLSHHALTCAFLLKRMIDDDYHDRARRREKFKGDNWATHLQYMKNQDQRYLGILIGKHLQSMWD